jgi:hypothetical protein
VPQHGAPAESFLQLAFLLLTFFPARLLESVLGIVPLTQGRSRERWPTDNPVLGLSFVRQ